MVPIPGVHDRKCPGCGHDVVVTEDTSTSVSRNELTEVRRYMCPECGQDNQMVIPSWRNDPTTSDVTRLGQWFARRRQRSADRAREKQLDRDYEAGPNG